jgi:hypothetical protein
MPSSPEPADEQLTCPIHGDVEGITLTEGPLSETHPWALLCEECEPHADVIVGWELDGHGVRRNWEDFGRALVE